jgi:arylsulfatase A-like enzyme
VQEGLFDPTLVLFTSDHGEGMGEHGVYFEHGRDTHEELARVPLVVKPPAGRWRRGGRVAAPVSALELLPTTLEILSLPPPEGIDGRSFAAALEDGGFDSRPVFIQARRRQQHWARIDGWRKTMLVERGGETTWSLFELAGDPEERQPLAPSAADQAALADWVRRARAYRTVFKPVRNILDASRTDIVQERLRERDREDLERLRALGYVQ